MGRKLIDMTGVRVGRLVVVGYAGNELWDCKCDCGNVVQRRGATLRRSKNSSCGCANTEILQQNGYSSKKELIGKRIGKLTVIGCSFHTIGDEVFECECDCGEHVFVKRRYLVSGSKTHCGCQNRKDMVGKKIGMLTVLSFAGMGKHGTAMWNCRCNCGNEKVVDGALLRSGMSISCGCLQAIATSKARKKYNEYCISDGIVTVRLSNSDKEMLCDVDDWERLKEYCWHGGGNGYAVTNVPEGSSIYRSFHMNVIECPDDMVRDHINRNRLDNRKCNLRIVSRDVNARNTNIQKNNTSGYKGVTKGRDGKYVAQISVGDRTFYLGRYRTAEEAYAARLDGERKYFGEVYSVVMS